MTTKRLGALVWWSVFTLASPLWAAHIDRSSSRLTGGRSLTGRAALLPPPGDGPRPGFASLPDVSVTCSASDFVVRVKRKFFGLGAEPEELRLGRGCRSNGELRPHGDLLFTYPLTRCLARRETPPGLLVYKYVLHYEPSPRRIARKARRMDVDIECRFQRYHHVHQLAVQPTWQTTVLHKRLSGNAGEFLLQLMDDMWVEPAETDEYELGQMVHFQVSALHVPAGAKLYVSSCYATPFNGSETGLRYGLIDNFGCLLDSQKNPGASRFHSRTHDTLRFSLQAFQFVSDPDAEVQVQCDLFVASEDPGPTQKSCSYAGDRWLALTGEDSICDCCDSRCVTSKSRRAMMEGSASSEPLLVSDQPGNSLPSPVSISRKDRLEVQGKAHHQIDELHNYENTDRDIEYGYNDGDHQIPNTSVEHVGGMETGQEFDLPDLGPATNMMMGSDLEEDGWGNKEDFQREGPKDESEREGREDGHYDVYEIGHVGEELEVTHHMASGSRVAPAEDVEEKSTEEGEEGEGAAASELRSDDHKETTWYFAWR